MVHLIEAFISNSLHLIWAWKTNFLIVFAILFLEFLFPARRFNFKQNLHRVVLGFVYLLITIVIVGPIITFINQNVGKIIPNIEAVVFGLRNNDWPLLSIIIGTAVWWLWWDFFQYWAHRLVHTKSLFSLHRHHHDVELDAFASFRHSPIELVYAHTLITIPTTIYFTVLIPEVGLQWQHLLVSFIVLIEHSNIRFGWPLSYIFITPQMHRIHHSVKREQHDSNYGFALSIWDRIFGTYSTLKQRDIEEIIVGLEWQDHRPTKLGWRLWLPFMRK